MTGHPLDQYEDKIHDLATHDTSNLEGLEKGAEVAICGVLTGVQRKRNREQKPWAAAVLEDRNGSVEALVFATAFERLAQFRGRGFGGAGARPGAAGGERPAEDLRAGHYAARRGARALAERDFDPRMARQERRR